MAEKPWLLLVLATFLFCTVLCQVDKSSEETEKYPAREGKYMIPFFGRFPADSGPCSSSEEAIEVSKHAGLDPDNIALSNVFVEEKELSNSDISELLQLLREFKKHNFEVPKHSGQFNDAEYLRQIYQSMQNGEEISTDTGALPQMGNMGYAPFYPYPLSLNPCLVGQWGFGPWNQYPYQLDNSRPRNSDFLEQVLSPTLSTTTLPTRSFGNSLDNPNAIQDSFSTTNYPNTNTFLSQPAESFEEVIIKKHQQNLPVYTSWPFSQTTTEEVTTERCYLPSTVRVDDPLNEYTPGSYRTFQSTPMTKTDEVSGTYYSPNQNSYSSASTITEEASTMYYPYNYKTDKTSLLKSPEDSLSTYYPANHRRYYTEDMAISHRPPSFGGNRSPTVISTEEVSASLHPSRYRTQHSPSAHIGSDPTRYVAQGYYPSTVTAIEDTVVEVPVTYTEGYYPTKQRYISTTGYPSNEPGGYTRAYYTRYPMYQTNG